MLKYGNYICEKRHIILVTATIVFSVAVACKQPANSPTSGGDNAALGRSSEMGATRQTAQAKPPEFGRAGPRLALIGLDAADWNIMNPLIAGGKLPTLTFLKENGVWGHLKSIKPMLSPALWTTIATGKTRDEHGIKDFTIRGKNGKLGLVTSRFRSVKALWNILSEQKLKVGFISWMTSFPAEEVNGFMVSNYLKYFYPQLFASKGKIKGTFEHLGNIVYPEELQSKVKSIDLPKSRFFQAFGENKIKVHHIEGNNDPVLDIKIKDYIIAFKFIVKVDELTQKLALRVLPEYNLDLFGIYFQGIDAACHLFWSYTHPDEVVSPEAARDLGGIIDEYYVFSDGYVADLLTVFSSETNIIIVSDHGYGKVGRGHHHLENGIILLAGPAFKKGAQLKEASILDVTPTILYVLDLPIARDMKGKVLFSAIDDDFKKTHVPKWIDSYETPGVVKKSEEPFITPLDDDTRERLRALGYID
jgi:predicted AlkP superfamily phosphohydrolase/phosphomutase